MDIKVMLADVSRGILVYSDEKPGEFVLMKTDIH